MNLKCIATVLGMLVSMTTFAQWGEDEAKEKLKGYELNGRITGRYEGKVYLVKEDGMHGNQTRIDSCEVVNGCFQFKNDVVPEYPVIYFVQSHDGQIAPVFLEAGRIDMMMRADYFLGAVTTGTINNYLLRYHDMHYKFWVDLGRIDFNINFLRYGEGTPEQRDKDFKGRTQEINTNKLELEKKMVRKYNDQAFAPFIILFEMTHELSVAELKELFSQLSPEMQKHPYALALKEVIINKECKVGSKAPDFSMTGMDGKEVELKNFAGKYVLLDFWASWCAPCRGEMPNLVKLYKEYKDQNFEIIGISLDQKEDAWKKAVKDLHMTWPQVCDFQVWYGQTARRYNLSAVPFTVLINPDGVIEAMNLRGEELVNTIKDALKKKR